MRGALVAISMLVAGSSSNVGQFQCEPDGFGVVVRTFSSRTGATPPILSITYTAASSSDSPAVRLNPNAGVLDTTKVSKTSELPIVSFKYAFR